MQQSSRRTIFLQSWIPLVSSLHIAKLTQKSDPSPSAGVVTDLATVQGGLFVCEPLALDKLVASMVEPCRCGHTAGRLVLTNRYVLRNIFLIMQLSMQQSGKHSILAQFHEYTCFLC